MSNHKDKNCPSNTNSGDNRSTDSFLYLRLAKAVRSTNIDSVTFVWGAKGWSTVCLVICTLRELTSDAGVSTFLADPSWAIYSSGLLCASTSHAASELGLCFIAANCGSAFRVIGSASSIYALVVWEACLIIISFGAPFITIGREITHICFTLISLTCCWDNTWESSWARDINLSVVALLACSCGCQLFGVVWLISYANCSWGKACSLGPTFCRITCYFLTYHTIICAC